MKQTSTYFQHYVYRSYIISVHYCRYDAEYSIQEICRDADQKQEIVQHIMMAGVEIQFSYLFVTETAGQEHQTKHEYINDVINQHAAFHIFSKNNKILQLKNDLRCN